MNKEKKMTEEIVSHVPKLRIIKRGRYSRIDLDLITCNYDLNRDGVKIIKEQIYKLKPFIKPKSVQQVYFRVINITILNEYVGQFVEFLLQIVKNKNYQERDCIFQN